MTAPELLSVILPCRNQADHIGTVLRRFSAELEGMPWAFEVVAVPNASTDGTDDAVAEVAAADPRIRVVSNPRGGWGLSVLTGIRAARGEVVCYTNSARTDPQTLRAVVGRYLAGGVALAKARRVRRGALVRGLGSWLFNAEGRLLLGVKAADVNGTPKVLARTLLADLALREEGDLLDLELMALLSRRHLAVAEVEVEGFQRHGGRSSTGLRSAYRMYMGALKLRSRLAREGAPAA